MAALSWVGGAFPVILSYPPSTIFGSLAGGYNDGQTTETRTQIPSAAGTWSHLSVNVTTNPGIVTARFRFAATNGAQNVSTGSGAVGIFTDLTNSDAVGNGVMVNISLTTTVTGSEFGAYGLEFSSSGAVTTYFGAGASSSGVGSAAYFCPFAYSNGVWNGATGNEASAQGQLQVAGTLSQLTTFQVNGLQTVRTRINGANGNLVCVPSAAGLTQDTTHTDAVSIGDLLCMSLSATTGEITYEDSVRFVSGGQSHDIWAARGPPGGSGITTNDFGNLWGYIDGSTTESQGQSRAPFALKLSKMRVQLISSGGVPGTQRLRVNGANGNQVISLPSGTTGWFTDTTGVDSINAGDLVCTSIVPTGGQLEYGSAMITLGPAATITAATGTAAGAGAAHGVALGVSASVGVAAGHGAASGAASTVGTEATGTMGGPIVVTPMLATATGVVVPPPPPLPPPPPPFPFPFANTLLLDLATWDVTVDIDGNIAMATLPYAPVQDAASAIRTFLGELWYDTEQGIPYLTLILGKPANLSFLKLQFTRAALTVPAVAQATAYITELTNRSLKGQVQLVLVDGSTASVGFVSIEGTKPEAFIVGHSGLSGGDVI